VASAAAAWSLQTVHGLAAKIWPESDPVYNLTAIDTNTSGVSQELLRRMPGGGDIWEAARIA
jgi:hypothetical protein